MDLLGRRGYLHTINEAGTPAKIRRAFAGIAEGSFVKLTSCRLRLPSYIRLVQISRATKGNESPFDIYYAATDYGFSAGATTATDEIAAAWNYAHPGSVSLGSAERLSVAPGLGPAIRSLVKTVGSSPRVPLSTCDGKTDYRPRGIDLLFPIRLANLSSEQSLLAGPVTVVGKLVRAVRKNGQEYADEPSFATFAGPAGKIDEIFVGEDAKGLGEELTADAVVLAPGAVILPVAIYK